MDPVLADVAGPAPVHCLEARSGGPWRWRRGAVGVAAPQDRRLSTRPGPEAPSGCIRKAAAWGAEARFLAGLTCSQVLTRLPSPVSLPCQNLLKKQVETRTADGRRRITPLCIAQLDTGYSLSPRLFWPSVGVLPLSLHQAAL